MTHAHSGQPFVGMVLMWQAMMTAMMGPIVWPWLRGYGRLHAVHALAATTAFGAGYFTAWLGFSLGAAVVQLAALRLGAMAGDAITAAPLRAAVLIVAGLYQFAPLKRACLTHCRNPLTVLLTRWRGGPQGGFRLGLAHGIHCVGCCWALMLTALALGMANLWWMAAIAAAAFVEQVLPRGDLARVPLGAALLAAGARLAFA